MAVLVWGQDSAGLRRRLSVVAELVAAWVERDLFADEASQRVAESARKIELQGSLVEVLESERLVLLGENARLGFRASVAEDEAAAAVAELVQACVPEQEDGVEHLDDACSRLVDAEHHCVSLHLDHDAERTDDLEREALSRPEVGSSRMSTGGSCTASTPMETRLRSPP